MTKSQVRKIKSIFKRGCKYTAENSDKGNHTVVEVKKLSGMLEELLDKQIEIKPDAVGAQFMIYTCSCGNRQILKNQNYCQDCGQRLKWDEKGPRVVSK